MCNVFPNKFQHPFKTSSASLQWCSASLQWCSESLPKLFSINCLPSLRKIFSIFSKPFQHLFKKMFSSSSKYFLAFLRKMFCLLLKYLQQLYKQASIFLNYVQHYFKNGQHISKIFSISLINVQDLVLNF